MGKIGGQLMPTRGWGAPFPLFDLSSFCFFGSFVCLSSAGPVTSSVPCGTECHLPPIPTNLLLALRRHHFGTRLAGRLCLRGHGTRQLLRQSDVLHLHPLHLKSVPEMKWTTNNNLGWPRRPPSLPSARCPRPEWFRTVAQSPPAPSAFPSGFSCRGHFSANGKEASDRHMLCGRHVP